MTVINDDALAHTSPIIGYHRAPLSQKFGAPRQPNLVALPSVIEMVAPYADPAAFIGLEAFSHIWLSWQFHHNFKSKQSLGGQAQPNKASAFRAQVRPPRLGGNQKIGVFASRSMYRPSGLGLSVVKLERIEIIEGRVLLFISGADMIDGTPIIDIKPYVAYSDAHSDAISGFAPTEPELATVTVSDVAQDQFNQIVNSDSLDKKVKSTLVATINQAQQRLMASDFTYIKALISQDPRPAYRREDCDSRFVMRYKSVDISFAPLALGELQIHSIIKF